MGLDEIQFFQFHYQFDTISLRKSSRGRFFLYLFEFILKGFDFTPIHHFLKYEKINGVTIFGRFGEENLNEVKYRTKVTIVSEFET